MSNRAAPADNLTPEEHERLTNDPRLRDYPAAELFEPREWSWVQFQRWLVEHGRIEGRE